MDYLLSFTTSLSYRYIINTCNTVFKDEFALLAIVGEGVDIQIQVYLNPVVLSFHYLFLLELISDDKEAMFLLGNFLHLISSYHN